MATAKEATTKVASGKVVKYIGTADTRRISASDWKSIDVEDQNQVVWDKSNKFTVQAADLTEAALNYLATDSGFVISDAEA